MPAAGLYHTVLLRSDGKAVAFGKWTAVADGPFGWEHPGWERNPLTARRVLLRTDGTYVEFGQDDEGQLRIPP